MIVPVRNGVDSLPALLHSLAAQSVAAERFEVIVVDNDSSDGTGDQARALGAITVCEPVANRARARNTGVAAAQSSLFAFTDADCVAHERWLESLLHCADRAPLVAGEVTLSTGHPPNAIERFETMWRFGQEAWVTQQGWAATANLLVRRDAFEAIGGFDPAWRHIAEDADFCLRARAAGFPLVFCREAIIEHRAESALGPMLQRLFRHGYSSNQAFYRLGVGHRAWRDPRPALRGDRALREIGHDPGCHERDEWRRMARLGRLGYAARLAGSIWAELEHAR